MIENNKNNQIKTLDASNFSFDKNSRVETAKLEESDFVKLQEISRIKDSNQIISKINSDSSFKDLVNNHFSSWNEGILKTEGISVKTLQIILKKFDPNLNLGNSGRNSDGVDGVFGVNTFVAILEMQKILGLNPTGVANSELLKLIFPTRYKTLHKNEGKSILDVKRFIGKRVDYYRNDYLKENDEIVNDTKKDLNTEIKNTTTDIVKKIVSEEKNKKNINKENKNTENKNTENKIIKKELFNKDKAIIENKENIEKIKNNFVYYKNEKKDDLKDNKSNANIEKYEKNKIVENTENNKVVENVIIDKILNFFRNKNKNEGKIEEQKIETSEKIVTNKKETKKELKQEIIQEETIQKVDNETKQEIKQELQKNINLKIKEFELNKKEKVIKKDLSEYTEKKLNRTEEGYIKYEKTENEYLKISKELSDFISKKGNFSYKKGPYCGLNVGELLIDFGIKGLPRSGRDGYRWEGFLDGNPNFIKEKISDPSEAKDGGVLVYKNYDAPKYNSRGKISTRYLYGHVEIKSDGKYWWGGTPRVNPGAGRLNGFTGYVYYPKVKNKATG